MNKSFQRFLSLLVALTLLINMLPLSIFAVQEDSEDITVPSQTATTDTEMEDVQIIGEVTEKRTEFSKEFVLSNGLHMATVYAEAVHYEENGEWKDIDNTLQQKSIDGKNSYINADGIWNVTFPQQLSDKNGVSIEKDGYSLEFFMAGEIHSAADTEMVSDAIISDAEVDAVSTFMMEIGDTAALMLLTEAEEATAEVHSIDLSQVISEAKFPETISEELHSRLEYADVYTNTDIVYDLNSNQLKESIVMEQFDDSLHGYRYELNVGELKPVLTDSGSIELYDKNNENIVMVMPAPYLVDDNQQYCYDVTVDLQKNSGTYTLTYLLPQEWLAEEDRPWPVILDPIVSATSNYANIQDITVFSRGGQNAYTSPNLWCGYDFNVGGSMRSYIKYIALPQLTSADIIVSASVHLYRNYSNDNMDPVEVHKVNESWDSTTMYWHTQPDFDETIADYSHIQYTYQYFSWNVTDIVRGWYAGENTGMMFKAPDYVEDGSRSAYKRFNSSDNGSNQPALTIMFRNNNGLENYWDYTSASAGRTGTGYINNYTGNLVWVHDDIGFGGNLMPVSISHIYNANDSLNNDFGMGYGWRSNFNQRVYYWDDPNAYGDYYIWEDADGTKHYFLKNSDGKYEDEDGLELTLTITEFETEKYCISDKYDNCSYFDSLGRLVKMENNQATKSSISITYITAEGYMISTITDGAGRVYSFSYTDNLLSRISYLGSGETEISYLDFGYYDSQLITITYQDGAMSEFAYTDKNLFMGAQDIDRYRLTYYYNTYLEGQPSRVEMVEECDNGEDGGYLRIGYAKNQTTFTDHNGNVQIMQFNNLGNTISIQDDQGRARYAQYAINDTSDGTTIAEGSDTVRANQLRLSSKTQNTVGNMLDNSSFESDTLWMASSDEVTVSVTADVAYMGSKSLRLSRSEAGESAGAVTTFAVDPGETFTFSGYVKTDMDSAAFLALSDGTTAATSSILAADSDWTRMEVSFTATEAVILTAQLLTETAGAVYMDCVQVERAPTASRYNLVENGDFRYTTAWDSSTGRTMFETAAAPELNTDVYNLAGIPNATNRLSQTVQVSGAAGDSFVVGGWAKGNSVPLDAYDSNPREFGIIATFNNTDGTTTPFTVRFNPYTDSSVNWQYAAAPIVADKAYSSIKVELAYDYNANTIYFDGIQLYKEVFGNSYTYDTEGNVVSVKDLQGQETKYEYTDNDLTKQILPTGAELTYIYDDYHNVQTATTEEGLSYGFTYDAWGNNTSVAILSGDTELNSTATYSADGNRLVSTTDTSGNTTQYSYHADTNALEWVQYPEDTEETRTEYTYDEMYRIKTVVADTESDLNFFADYGYDNDHLTGLMTPSTIYSFTYGEFDLIRYAWIGHHTLAEYTYTADGNNYLDTLAYGNGGSVEYSYDNQGRVTQQTYEDDDTVEYRYDNSGALATVTDSATGITTTYYYDFTDRLMKYVESGDDYNHSVTYGYDSINNLTEIVETINGVTHSTGYAYDADNRVTAVSFGEAAVNYTYDPYGRISQQQTKKGVTPLVTSSYTYMDAAEASAQTSLQVETLRNVIRNRDITYTYTYDANGNITSVHSRWDNPLTKSPYTETLTRYVYDSQNQLVCEFNEAAERIWEWTYDDAGNILSRAEYLYTEGELGEPLEEVVYAYEDGEWGDLLTSYDGNTITYDDIGNPLNDGTWTYTWEHGRELASMSDGETTWTYTYDANGMRTSRSDGITTYKYIYNGDKLVQMTVGEDVLSFTYDAAGHPATLTYNGAVFYYVTNLQGDVIWIVDSIGMAYGEYTYDAWGNVSVEGGSLLKINPLRYRGYVYDNETGLYYVSSRYYDPEIGRFINADDVNFLGAGSNLTSYNLFAYCGNNPVMGYDPTGHWDWGWEEQAALGTTVLIVGLALLLAAPTGGSSLAFGALALSSSTAVAAGSAMAITGTVMVGDAVAQATVNYAKQSKKSGKERATDKPSWVSQSDVDLGKSSQQNATDLLNNKYGSGNWGKGPRTEFNQIVKWIDRGLKAVVLIMADMLMEE